MNTENIHQERSVQEISSPIQSSQIPHLKDLPIMNLLCASPPTPHKKSADHINVEVLMKMEQMNKDLLRLAKEKENFIQSLENERENTRRLELQNKELNNSYQVANNNLQIVIEDNDNFRKENEKLINEKLFFQQDITLYKSQSQDLKQILEDYEESIHESDNNKSGTNIAKTGKRRVSQEKLEIMDKYEGIIMELKVKIHSLENQNTDAKLELDKINDILIQLNQTNEELESQNNHLNRKYICLSQERSASGSLQNLAVSQSQGQGLNQNKSQNQINNQNSGEGGKNSNVSSGLVSPSSKKERSNSDSLSNNTPNILENNPRLLTDRLVLIEEKQKDKEKIQILEEEVKFMKDQIQKLTITNET